jgi:DNA polymerase-3 subunit gamma/tau
MQPRTFSLRYRPQTFAELFDQEHIKKTLINAISSNRLAHAYLFTGPRGVGKTTTANTGQEFELQHRSHNQSLQ